MNRITTLRQIGITCVATIALACTLSACGTSSAENKPARVRYLNLLGDHTTVNVTLDAKPVATGVAFQTVSNYYQTGSNNYAAVISNTAGTSLSSYTQGLGQLHYTVYLYGTAAEVKHLNVSDEPLVLKDGTFTTRILVASDTLTGHDLYVTAADTDIATATPNAAVTLPATLSAYTTVLDAGSFRVRITATGTKNVVFDRTLDFASKSADTFVLYADPGVTTPSVLRVGQAEGAVMLFPATP